jgi:glucose/arabinose dehydrogenase
LIRLLFILFVTLTLFCVPAAGQQYRLDTLARAPNVQYPVSLAYPPDGTDRFFFTEKNSGRVRVYDHGLQSEPFVTVPVEDEGEQGLLGLAFHPAYPDTPYVYLFYTRRLDRFNVVERYRDSSGTGVDPKLVLVIPRRDEGVTNNGGAILFGPDHTLYVGVGDHGTVPAHAQDIVTRRNYFGKILRINEDGSIPADNPIPGSPIWAFGVRNPQGLTFDSETGILYCTDGGAHDRNEVNRVSRGANLGWPLHNVGEKPLVTFSGDNQPALTGVAVYHGSAFPRLRGKFLVAGNLQPVLWLGTQTATADSILLTPLFRSNTGFADVRVSPDGAITLTNGPYLGSRLMRLSPLMPAYISSPPLQAVESELYSYTPSFAGTPPELHLLAGPEGMFVDTTTWSVRWIPTNAQALAPAARVVMRAQNGAGYVDQSWTIRVVNLNDPPLSFQLSDTTEQESLRFVGVDPLVDLSWHATSDPDGDSLQYHVQLDTTLSFDSPLLRDTTVSRADTLRLLLSRASHEWFWRVAATDGRLVTFSTPVVKRLLVTYIPPFVPPEVPDRFAGVVSEQEQTAPANPVSAIKYVLPRGGYVRLSVFNLLGQEVSRVCDGTQGEGTYEVALSSLNLPSGVYIYRLQAPGVRETRKIVIAP